ncbi:hypothetical protein SHKM778_06290 [Streptomyces sp. KM77-8]|uniref:Uncharacterized protein n=1 Tax=Streptomyces haneummycinicus TaxID=3074435 RepID=A0AAT9HA39_9ACTN
MRVPHDVRQRVALGQPAARELAARPGHRRRVVAQPGVRGAGPRDVLFQRRARVFRVLVQAYAEPALRDQQIGHAARPVPGAYGADRQGVRDRVLGEQRVRGLVPFRLQGGERPVQGR